jgi:hypothetical protein
VASSPRDQVHLRAHHGLARNPVEALHHSVLGQDVETELVKKKVERPPLRFVLVKERASAASEMTSVWRGVTG